MKHLFIYRGQSSKNFKCTNGDIYDSAARLQDHARFGPVDIWHSEFVNTDSTGGYKGGKLAKGEYYGIIGYRADKDGIKGKRVIKLFTAPAEFDFSKITANDLTMQMMTLPSEIPNPNHSNLLVIQHVQVHDGGQSWDFSHGCITVYRHSPHDDWKRLMDNLADNETIKVILT